MRQKAEREEAAEKEKAILKAAKEKEIARLREQQEKSQDLQTTLDEMNALRAQEEVFYNTCFKAKCKIEFCVERT